MAIDKARVRMVLRHAGRMRCSRRDEDTSSTLCVRVVGTYESGNRFTRKWERRTVFLQNLRLRGVVGAHKTVGAATQRVLLAGSRLAQTQRAYMKKRTGGCRTKRTGAHMRCERSQFFVNSLTAWCCTSWCLTNKLHA